MAADPVFLAPDSGPDKVPYTCSFHWFRVGKGDHERIIGLDLIRSDDKNRRGLRVFEINSGDGTIRSWIHESPSDEWGAFTTESKPDLNSKKPVIGRGKNWIAGTVAGVSFDLAVMPLSEGQGTGKLGLAALKMNAEDFTQARTVGWIQLDGAKIPVDGIGPLSIHYGDSLPQYAYFATVPQQDQNPSPQILMSSIGADDLRGPSDWLDGIFFTYAYGSQGLPGFFFYPGSFDGMNVRLGLRTSVKLTDLHRVDHSLLGEPTVTAAAHAFLTEPDPTDWLSNHTVDLGWIVLDYRGRSFLSSLGRN